MTNKDIEGAFFLLGITTEEILDIKNAPSTEEASALLNNLKKRARYNYRAISKFVHPDRHQDPRRTNLFKLLASVVDKLDSTEVEEILWIRTQVTL